MGPLWIITKPDKNPPLDKVNLRGHFFGQGTRVRVRKKKIGRPWSFHFLQVPRELSGRRTWEKRRGSGEGREGSKREGRKERREFLEGVGFAFSSRQFESPREHSHSHLTVPQGHPPASKYSCTQKAQSCLKRKMIVLLFLIMFTGGSVCGNAPMSVDGFRDQSERRESVCLIN